MESHTFPNSQNNFKKEKHTLNVQTSKHYKTMVNKTAYTRIKKDIQRNGTKPRIQ